MDRNAQLWKYIEDNHRIQELGTPSIGEIVTLVLDMRVELAEMKTIVKSAINKNDKQSRIRKIGQHSSNQ